MRSPTDRQRRAMAEALWLDLRGIPESVRCIHGHFLPVKYLLYATRRDATFVTWLREPVDRMLSHYYYMRRMKPGNPMHRRLVDEDWSVERFTLGPEFRNFYHQYFWGFPLENFAFIGIQEHYSDDLQYFASTFLGSPVSEVRTNVGRSEAHAVSDQLRQAIAEHHAEDVSLYQRALAIRDRRP